MRAGVVDAGVAIGWLHHQHRSFPRIERLFAACRGGESPLVMSIVNLAEVLRHTAELSRTTGVDPVALLSVCGVRFHSPDEAVARRAARLRTSLADGFAAATAQELGARLHATDRELTRRIAGTRLSVTHY